MIPGNSANQSPRRVEQAIPGKSPKVSIGLPVYNGEKYLRQSIESVLAQEFSDFELLISDNASTDSTWDICREYADKDKRIRLFRQQQNLGATANFNYVFYNTSAPYFMWHAHDDILKKGLVDECHTFLEANPDYILCSTRTMIIDESGREIYAPIWDYTIDDSEPQVRIKKFIEMNPFALVYYSLIRRRVLASQMPLHIDVLASDHLLILKLSLAGKWYQINETLRSYREGATPTCITQIMEGWPRTVFGSGFHVPLAPMCQEVVIVIKHLLAFQDLAPMTKADIIWWLLTRGRYRHFVFSDLEYAIKALTYRNGSIWNVLRLLKHCTKNVAGLCRNQGRTD